MKYILILGATSDVARPLASLYAETGCGLYLASRDLERLERLANDLNVRYGIPALAMEFDITRMTSHQQFYDSLPEKPFGVVCLAGYLGTQGIAQNDFAEVEKIIGTNYLGCVSILGIVASDLERRREGFIVGVSSVAGERGRKTNYVYGSAKSGFTAFLSGLRNRLFGSNVQVLTVHPGFVATKMIANLDTPKLLTATPHEAAKDIFEAQQKGKDFMYTKWMWRYIMIVLRHVPESIFKRLTLQ